MTTPLVARQRAAVPGDDATIAAIATAPGRGALAIVRVSGSRARTIAEVLLGSVPTEARRAHYTTVRDEQGSLLDDVVATLFIGPHSFTGEDLLEISTHGGAVVPTMVLAAAIAAGARQAEPGEFTRRAVLNGRLDLIQAEAIGDLIDARSSAAHRVARRQLDGGLSTRIAELRVQLLTLDALLAYDIDFPEEDDGPISRDRVEAAITSTEEALSSLLATGAQGALVHEGALVVLAGAPNVGKSALFNALLGESRAIVTEVAGTTRDAIEAVLDLPGYPLRLVDTAGLRDTSDEVERLGIETSSRYLRRADVVLACADSAAALSDIASVRELTDAPVITVATKADLGSSAAPGADVVVSAVTGAGVQDLLQLIEKRLEQSRGALSLDAPLLTRARHRVGVQRAHEELTAFRTAWSEGALPAVIAAAHVRAAADALSELIGVVQVDDVLDVVFRTFCVGK